MPRLHEVKRDRATKRAEFATAKAALRASKAALRTKAEELPVGEELPADDVSAMDALQAQVDALEAECDALDTRISQLEQLQDDDAGGAEEVEDIKPGDVEAAFAGGVRRGSATPHGFGEPARGARKKGFFVARMMVGKAWMRNGMSPEKAAAEMERRFGDKDVAKALNTAGNSTGGATVPQDFVMEIIDLLRAKSVVRSLKPETRDMPRGNLTIPRLQSGATASYGGELDAIAPSQEGFDDLQMNAKKLTAMVPVSNDLIRRTPLNVEQIITDDLVRVTALREDLAFLLGDGSQGTPIGLYNQAPASNRLIIPAFSATDNATILGAVIGTVNGMKLTLKQGMSGMVRPAWVMPATIEAFLRGLRDQVGSFVYKPEMDAGTFEGLPFAVSQQIPTNINTGTVQNPVNNGSYLTLADFVDVIVADTLEYQLDIFDQATYVVGGVTVSAVQMDQTVFRIIQEHDLGVKHQASIAVAQVPGWAPSGFTNFFGGSSFYMQAPDGDSSAAPSTFGAAPPTGSNNPANIAANVPGGQLPGRA